MSLMLEKGIMGGICQATHRHAKTNIKYMNNYDKKIDLSYIEYLDANNLYGWAMFQKFLVNVFEWVKKLSKFNEDFIRSYDENSGKVYFIEFYVEYQIILFNDPKDLKILPERIKYQKQKNLFVVQKTKKNMLFI